MSSLPLAGQAALVTGASSGIGRAIAQALATQGTRVTLVARRQDRLEEVAKGIGAEATQVLAADLTDEGAAARVTRSAADRWEGLDIVINAAGLARQASLSEGDSADWRAMWEINVMATALVNRAALPHFDTSVGGHIVNLCSMSGHRIPGKGGFYPVTKFAVRAMTEGLRQELRLAGNPTRVSQLSPGFVDTELLDEYFGTSSEERYAKVDYPILQPEDVAATVIHVLTAPPHVDVTDVLMRPTKQGT